MMKKYASSLELLYTPNQASWQVNYKIDSNLLKQSSALKSTTFD